MYFLYEIFKAATFFRKKEDKKINLTTRHVAKFSRSGPLNGVAASKPRFLLFWSILEK